MSDPFELPGELNVYTAMETREALLSWVQERVQGGSAHLELSASGVQEIDGAGLQLLASLSKLETPWRLVGSSEAFSAACALLGYGHWIDKRYLKQALQEGAA